MKIILIMLMMISSAVAKQVPLNGGSLIHFDEKKWHMTDAKLLAPGQEAIFFHKKKSLKVFVAIKNEKDFKCSDLDKLVKANFQGTAKDFKKGCLAEYNVSRDRVVQYITKLKDKEKNDRLVFFSASFLKEDKESSQIVKKFYEELH